MSALLRYLPDCEQAQLILTISDETHLKALVDFVKSMLVKKELPFQTDIRDLLAVEMKGLSFFMLEVVSGKGWMRKSIYKALNKDGSVTFWWSCTKDGWYQNLGFLEGLLLGDESGGHQYFGGDCLDDAELMISYKETK